MSDPWDTNGDCQMKYRVFLGSSNMAVAAVTTAAQSISVTTQSARRSKSWSLTGNRRSTSSTNVAKTVSECTNGAYCNTITPPPSVAPTTAPTTAYSTAPTTAAHTFMPCTEQGLPGGVAWTDSDGDTCLDYTNGGFCDEYGDDFANGGFTAKQVCCGCG